MVAGCSRRANIDIASKRIRDKTLLMSGSGFNSNALNSNFLAPDGHNYFGIVGDKKTPRTNVYSFKLALNRNQ
jgi:hypothetical protein